MRTEDKILKILKQHTNGIMADELYEELSTPIPDEEVHSACAFLKKYGLITVGYGGESAKITPRGLQLLNLPDLPEDETTAPNEFSEATIRSIKLREDERQ